MNLDGLLWVSWFKNPFQLQRLCFPFIKLSFNRCIRLYFICFQVRIKIIQARQLQGANIHPVARVTCYNQTQQTRVQHSTNTPIWNQTFFFNFNVSPAELFDEMLEFQIFNSRRLRSDALIGSFKVS